MIFFENGQDIPIRLCISGSKGASLLIHYQCMHPSTLGLTSHSARKSLSSFSKTPDKQSLISASTREITIRGRLFEALNVFSPIVGKSWQVCYWQFCHLKFFKCLLISSLVLITFWSSLLDNQNFISVSFSDVHIFFCYVCKVVTVTHSFR